MTGMLHIGPYPLSQQRGISVLCLLSHSVEMGEGLGEWWRGGEGGTMTEYALFNMGSLQDPGPFNKQSSPMRKY